MCNCKAQNVECFEGIDSVDKAILNLIQGEFPVSLDPYGDIGREVGLGPDEAYERVMRLVRAKVVRKIGPFFDAKKMGYGSTLCAVDVAQEDMERAVKVINSYPEITHNYLREGSPNVWFTVIAESNDAIGRILSEITERGSIGPIYNLPAEKTFKIKVDLKIKD